MNEEAPALASNRLVSLDVFRGITMAGMVLVNHLGSYQIAYGPLLHAKWNGLTPTDLVFPAFLFIVGVAMTFSFDRRLAAGASRVNLMAHVCKRTIVLFLLGLALSGLFLDNHLQWRLVGPFVLMIAGLSFLFAEEKKGSGIFCRNGPEGASHKRSLPPFSPRGSLLLGTGLAVAAILWFVLDFDTVWHSTLRVPGVLQRIAVCYFIAALIVMFFGVRGRVMWTFVLLFGYWLIVRYVHPPADFKPVAMAERPDALLHDWIDVHLFGSHMYREQPGLLGPDPEGVLSTMTSVATTLLGVLTGNWLHARRDEKEKAIGLFAAANMLLVAGLWMNCVFPINKKIWTSSYVLVTAGISLHVLAMCYWLVDVRKSRWWIGPFLVYGTNAILAYIVAGLIGRILTVWQVHLPDGKTTSLFGWLYPRLFTSWAEPRAACLLYALAYTLMCLALMTPLYCRRIFVKV